MIKPSARWCALTGLSLLLPANQVWAADDPATAVKTTANAVIQQFGSAEGIRQHASLPLTDTNSQLSTVDGTKTASVQISNPSSSAFLSISITAMATGDLRPVQV